MSQEKEREAFERRMLDFGWRNFTGDVQGEPPCWYYANADLNARWIGWREARAALASQQAVKGEPYAHIVELPAGEYAGTVKFFTAPSDPRGRPVYLHQPSPPSREPLTNEQIEAVIRSMGFKSLNPYNFARAIERAHGIHSREGESND